MPNTIKKERQFSHDQTKDQSIMATMMGKVLETTTKSTNPFVAKQNILTFKHGTKWSGIVTTETGEKINEAELELKSAQSEVDTRRIEDVDLAVIDEIITSLSSQFSESFEESVISEITKVTEHRHPVELRLNGDILTEVRKLWESIELDLNEDFSLSVPSLILSPGAFKDFQNAIERNSEQKVAIESEIEAIKRRKHLEAIRRHLENLLKFSIPDEVRDLINYRLREIQQLT